MMLPTYYLLQVIICSGILFLYYHVALRNQVFHQWNRFYLLAAVILSLALPLIDWNLDKEEAVPVAGIVTVITDIRTSMDVVSIQPETYSVSDLILPAYIFICLVLLIFLFVSVLKILSIIRRHEVKRTGSVYFIEADVKGTPFSFFRYIFWNKRIDLASDTGKRIARHEIVHVTEWHSLDKLFIQVVLVFFWINPFYWLIRRELRSIHEFIADQRSAGDEGSAALAAMILESSYQKNFSFITNQFFNTSIKRRIAMITKSNAKVNYFSRILALPVIAIIAFAFTVKAQQLRNEIIPPVIEKDSSGSEIIVPVITDTVPHPDKKATRVDFLKNGKAVVYFKTGLEITTWEDAVKKKFITAAAAEEQKKALKKDSEPLIIFNGEVKIEHTERSSDIFRVEGAHVTILKPEEAVVKYGARGKNGAIEFAGGKLSHGNAEPIFTKVDREAKIDQVIWRKFIQANTLPVIQELLSKGNPGKYTVIMQLLIDADGNVTEAGTVYDYDLGIGKLLTPILMKSPQWEPAVQNGKKVRSYIKQPITFVIDEDSTHIGATLPTHDPEVVKKMTLQQLLGVNDSEQVLSCIIAMDLPNGDIVEIKNSGNTFSNSARQLIEKADKGLLLTVDAILVQKDDGSSKKVPAKAYKM